MTWNLEQLREDVRFLFGDQQRECLSSSLNSIVDRQTYARFHYQESKRILGEVLNDRDDQAILIDLVFGADRNAHHEFAYRRKFAEAHIVAFLQSLHSLSDILAHAIYFALGLNLQKATRLPPKRVYLHKVRALLPPGELSIRLQELIDHEDYLYLADIVNHSKHRSVVQTPYSVDVTGCDTQPHGLKFAAFVLRRSCISSPLGRSLHGIRIQPPIRPHYTYRGAFERSRSKQVESCRHGQFTRKNNLTFS